MPVRASTKRAHSQIRHGPRSVCGGAPKPDSGSHGDHHHYLSGGLVAGIEDGKIRLSANGDAAVLLEEESGGGAIADSAFNWKTVGIGAAAVAGVAAAGVAGAAILKSRSGSGAKSGGAKAKGGAKK